MNLIEDWQSLWHKLWSVRLALLSALLGVLELTLPHFQSFIPPMWFGVLSVIVGVAAAVARLVQQTTLPQ